MCCTALNIVTWYPLPVQVLGKLKWLKQGMNVTQFDPVLYAADTGGTAPSLPCPLVITHHMLPPLEVRPLSYHTP